MRRSMFLTREFVVSRKLSCVTRFVDGGTGSHYSRPHSTTKRSESHTWKVSLQVSDALSPLFSRRDSIASLSIDARVGLSVSLSRRRYFAGALKPHYNCAYNMVYASAGR